MIANNPHHLGGAIDADAADKATRFLRLCEAHRLAIVSLCDTPGFMVGPEAENDRDGTPLRRHVHRRGPADRPAVSPWCCARPTGSARWPWPAATCKAPLLCVAWPTGEFGGMGLEGAVRLGYRKELDAIADPAARQERLRAAGRRATTSAARRSAPRPLFEIDDVIDPAQTRHVLIQTLARTRS